VKLPSRTDRAAPLPSPGVHLGREYLARVERLVPRVRAARERREGPGGPRGGAFSGGGLEFVGYRPYRPGESLRGIDWSLYARLDRPFVRMARHEAAERWALLLDASASMGVGTPGKLQAAAELAGALASLALAHGAQVQLLASGDPAAELVARKPIDLPRVLAFLSALTARGRAGLAALAAEPARFRAAGRVFAIGDLLDVEPRELFTAALGGRRGRELACVQVLAPEELRADTAGESVVWIDAETGERRALELTRATCAAYEAALSRRLSAWADACARHRVAHGSWSSATPFEDVCTALVGA
jgi:uncharacterized protein (DUF58 family)